MAVTLVSRPTTPNVTGTKLLFEVSGSNISYPQYSYVMDLYLSGSSDVLVRQFQIPNVDGVAQFEPSQVLQSYLSYDNFWKLSGSAYPINAAKTFDFKFGEAYGTSISSSLTVYTGSSHNYLQVFPGVIDPNSGNYNFVTSSFKDGTRSQYLSNLPSYNYQTVWITDTQFYSKNDYVTATQFYDALSNGISIIGYLRVGNSTTDIATISVNPAANPEYPNERFVTYGLGPKNITDNNNDWLQYIESGSINFISTASDIGLVQYYIRDNVFNNYVNLNDGDVGAGIPYEDEDSLRIPLNTQFIQFAFINRYGFYDYYNVYSPLKRETTLKKNIVSLPKVDYSGTVSTYSIETGGDYDYHTEINDEYSITTDWLNQQMSNWLEELLESPEVFVRQGNEYVPIVITNQQYQHNNSEARNKLFQYTINFIPANGREIFQDSYINKNGVVPKFDAYLSSSDILITYMLVGPDSGRTTGQYSPYWRFEDRILLFSPYTGSNSISEDFLYKSGSIPFNSQLATRPSTAATTAELDIDIYGDDSLIYSTSSVFYLPGGFQNYYFPYTASFTQSSYNTITWSASLASWTPPTCATSSFDPTLSGSLTLNHWYDFTDCSTMDFKIYEITGIQDKGNSPTPVNLSVNTGSYFSGPIFQGSNSGSLFNSDRFDWKGLETRTVPATMIATGSTLTYVAFLDLVGEAEGRANIPGEQNKTKGTVVYGANQSHIGYRSIQPIRYDSASYAPQPPSQSIVPADGNQRLGLGIQRLSDPTVYTVNTYDAGFESPYMVMSEYNLDYDGSGSSYYGNVRTFYGSSSEAVDDVLRSGQTTQNAIQTIFSVGYSPIGVGPLYQDEDVSRTRIRHVMVYSGSISLTDSRNLYQEYLSTLVT